MGFTREQIVEIYADIFERFQFDKRENEMAKVGPAHVPATD